MKKAQNSLIQKASILLVATSTLFLTNCNPRESSNQDPSQLLLLAALSNRVQVRSAQDIAFESNEDYNDNNFGVITTRTLERWVTNWDANKPAGIPGKLVILQNRPTTGGLGRVIQGDGTRVVAYSFILDDENQSFLQRRFNGVVETEAIIPDGERVDQILNLYGIDPERDLIVFASEANAQGHYMNTLRAFYTLYYWGVARENLAVLNGTLANPTIQGNLPFNVGSSGNTPPALARGTFTVRRLRRDHTIIQLPLEDTKRAVANPTNHGIWGLTNSIKTGDARSAGEFNGTHVAGDNSDPRHILTGSNRPTNTRYAGTLRGAIHTPWQDLLNPSANGFTLRTKAELRAYYDARGFSRADTVIQLCRTNYRAQINGLVTIAVLGIPTTYYDGGWIEWGNLVAGGGNPTLRADSPFRTDLPEFTDRGNYNTAANSTPPPSRLNPTGTTTRQIILDDKAYKPAF